MPAQQKRALISVYDKHDIETAARILHEHNWEILSTGGTAAHLRSHGIPVTEVNQITGFPQILDGRVKTLHPMIFGPILARDIPDHHRALEELGGGFIELVMVNFYPFEKALEDTRAKEPEMVEKIDVGGPSMVRAAAKNHARVTVVVDAADYLPVCRKLAAEGGLDPLSRKHLAAKAFAATAHYDALIAGYFGALDSPATSTMTITGRKHMDLRYGENPHQAAGLFLTSARSPLKRMRQWQGKDLSFNNILDATMVWEVLSRFQQSDPFSVIVKHQNPCGAATGNQLASAFAAALEADPVSAFGGIVGFNQPLDAEAASLLKPVFLEVVIAPAFTPAALKILKSKKNLRLLEMPLDYAEHNDIRSVPGGFLWQEADSVTLSPDRFINQSERPATASEMRDVELGWKLIKFVKSNGILVVRNGAVIGTGAGQMSRVDSVRIALAKCGERCRGAVLLSDAFFPFPDSVETAAEHGISVVVETGGSIRDADVISTARKLNITLLFTGMRHFRH
ncbi:MAG: bifunctional phosphoribosylaminoimidazolecarboxamide formyltransferase/IMP cyclohydrolase [Acidobacteriota bacterium]|jgi:phosphoribosylaminoimidazolecarboxamide formyltransferase/IMP cyclohydrolase|nr:bifunctional phosphoribosylaminoimidazolecarboxamide formyltransferase/IMP cyclohydrolase [Acidobacteriota bacterium]